MLHIPHNVKFKTMHYYKDLNKKTTNSKEKQETAAEMVQGVPLTHSWQTTNSDITGTRKLNHFFMTEPFPTVGT